MAGPRQPFTAVSAPDCAQLFVGGVAYRAYCYANNVQNSIECVCFIEQEHGQEVLLFRHTVASESARLLAGPDPDRLIRPKIVHSGPMLIVSYVDEDGGQLVRMGLDLATIDTVQTWTELTRFAIQPNTYGIAPDDTQVYLYDVAQYGNNSTLLTFRNVASDPAIICRRYALDGVTQTWSTIVLELGATNVLAVSGDFVGGHVFVTLQRVGGNALELWTWRFNGSNGSTTHNAQTFTSTDLAEAHWTNVGHAHITSGVTAIVGECRPNTTAAPGAGSAATESPQLRALAYRKINSGTLAQIGNEHYTYNLHLIARPWAYATGEPAGTDERDVYCCVGFKSWRSSAEWEQKNYFVVALDAKDWGEANYTVRPRPIVNLNLGTADARVGRIPNESPQYRENNHLSHITFNTPWGIDQRTRCFAAPIWTRVTSARTTPAVADADPDALSKLVPANASIVGYKVLMEAPQTINRDEENLPLFISGSHHGAYPWAPYQSLQVGRSLAIAGGTPSMYDGAQVAEIGFSWWPEIWKNTSLSTTEGNMKHGTYRWVAVYEWRDMQGQLHRSAPSRPYVLVLSDGEGDGAHARRLWIRCQNLSMREHWQHPQAARINIAIYRTEAGGAVFYRVHGEGATLWPDGTLENEPLNDPTLPWVIAEDNQDDDTLKRNEPLPWQLVDGIWQPLEPIQPPANTVRAYWQNRLWLAAGEQEEDIWYSMEIFSEPGGIYPTAPEFNPALTYRVDGGGTITALQPMDHAMVVFCRDRVFVLTGIPADGNGFNSSLQHQLIAAGTGCIEPRSVVLGPEGVYFQSEKGYYLLTRTLELDYVSSGAAIEDVIARVGNIRSATLLEDRHQIRLVANDDRGGVNKQYVLLYDYLERQWSTIEFAGAVANPSIMSKLVGGTGWRGPDRELVHVIVAEGAVLHERIPSATSYGDDTHDSTVTVRMSALTGWLNVAGIAGYQRVRSASVTLDKPSAVPVTVRVEYDLDGSYISAAEGGLSDTFTFSTGSRVLRIRPRYQKVTALRIRIEDEPPTAGADFSEGMRLQAITLDVGIKGKPGRAADANVGVAS